MADTAVEVWSIQSSNILGYGILRCEVATLLPHYTSFPINCQHLFILISLTVIHLHTKSSGSWLFAEVHRSHRKDYLLLVSSPVSCIFMFKVTWMTSIHLHDGWPLPHLTGICPLLAAVMFNITKVLNFLRHNSVYEIWFCLWASFLQCQDLVEFWYFPLLPLC